MSRRNRRSSNRRNVFFLWVVGIALVITVVTAYLLSTPQRQAEPTSPAAAAPQEVERITLEDSKVALDNNAGVFLDVRSESAYETSHIPGAVSIPLAELEPRIDELNPDQWIITYCT